MQPQDQQIPPVPAPAVPTYETPQPVQQQPQPVETPQAAPFANGQQPNAGQASTPQAADDGDLIEKEWVSQVNALTNTYKNDPFELNRQFAMLKADYLQKRYGKVIKSE